VWRAAGDDESLPIGLPVVCEHEASSPAAAAAAGSQASSSSSADRAPIPLDVNVCASDVMESAEVTAPDQLRHRCSWPEEALAEHLTDMRSC